MSSYSTQTSDVLQFTIFGLEAFQSFRTDLGFFGFGDSALLTQHFSSSELLPVWLRIGIFY